jgi:hypothetical protein
MGGLMAPASDMIQLEKPSVHIVHMLVFVFVVALLAAIMAPKIQSAFMANPGLNGVIGVTLLLGALYAFRMVWRLFPEVKWVNNFRLGEPNDMAMPVLLGPMSTILADATRRTVLSPQTMRSLLDSLASRLDETRDVLRYLVGLLIFLGLLGTFWGLLDTVVSVGDAIKALDVSSAQSQSVFEELKTGLQRPLEGMGLSFASSLFGLAGSLILGFLELKASQAQNRFYHNLEDWLSTITDLRAGDSGSTAIPSLLKLDMQSLQRSLERVEDQMGKSGGRAPNGNVMQSSIDDLADAVAGLVTQMREEQKQTKQFMQGQQAQQSEIQRLLMRNPRTRE